MVREFPKLAEQCAKEGTTFEQFLLRLVEQEMLDSLVGRLTLSGVAARAEALSPNSKH